MNKRVSHGDRAVWKVAFCVGTNKPMRLCNLFEVLFDIRRFTSQCDRYCCGVEHMPLDTGRYQQSPIRFGQPVELAFNHATDRGRKIAFQVG